MFASMDGSAGFPAVIAVDMAGVLVERTRSLGERSAQRDPTISCAASGGQILVRARREDLTMVREAVRWLHSR